MSSPTGPPDNQSGRADGLDFVRRHIWKIGMGAGFVLITIFSLIYYGTGQHENGGRRLAALPMQKVLPEFSLTDQDGAAFGTEQLKGKVWVASFIFTTCQTVCPRVAKATKALQDALDAAGPELKDVRLVSFTVDPEYDTPARLNAWGDKYGADHTRWKLLSGTESQIFAIVAKGFQTVMGDKETDDEGVADISHSTSVVLVDKQGWLRHYFGTSTPQEQALLVDYIRELNAETE